MSIYVGLSETNITPPPGCWMAGYAFRDSAAIGVHDELFARALILDDGRTRLAIVTMDLIALDFELVEQIRGEVTTETGMPGDALLLNATHTHGGPATRTFLTMGPPDRLYRRTVSRRIVEAIHQALKTRRPAQLSYGLTSCQIGVNRRPRHPQENRAIGVNEAGPVAPTVQALRIDDPSGETFALVYLHACHPVTLDGSNLLVTADWCGYACREIQEASQGRVMPFCLQGCAGNINPRRRGGFAEAEQNGRQVGRAALLAMQQALPLDDSTLAFCETVVWLPLIPPDLTTEEKAVVDFQEQWTQARQEASPPGKLLFLEDRLKCARDRRQIALASDPVLLQPFRVQCLRLGDVRVLGFPGEMFVQYQNDFSAQCSLPVFSAAFSNGCYGYVPTSADYSYGGYEIDDAYHYYGNLMFSNACERLIREETYRLLEINSPDWTPYSVQAEHNVAPSVSTRLPGIG